MIAFDHSGPDRSCAVVLLAGPSESSRIVYHALRREFGPVTAVLEEPVPRLTLLQRRVKKLGVTTVIGQILFGAAVVPLLRRAAADRIAEIVSASAFDASPISDAIHVSSVNAEETRQLLHGLAPRLVVVNGTRIIGEETLQVVNAPVINMHAGITPMFRGVHGAYWALVEQRPDLVGTTIHYVDRGIDTGRIISQRTCAVTAADSFVTYPYLQLAAGIPALIEAARYLVNGGEPIGVKRDDIPSVLRSHPTAWGYIARRTLRGVR